MENNETKLDLNRMQSLLNGLSDGHADINYNKDIRVETDVAVATHKKSTTNIFKEFKIENDPDDINIDFIDINMALNTDGRVVGHANIVDIDSLYDDIVANISQNDFKNAKCILCMYFINPDVSMFGISDIMEKLNELYGDAEMLFGTSTTDILEVNQIGYRILATGIQDDKMEQLAKNDDLDLRYHKQLYNENHQLKNKVDELQNKINRLEIQKDRLETSLLSLNKRYWYGKIYIIGDVHGCLKTLKALIAKIPKDAKILFVGDLIDRGSNSAEVVKYIRANGWDCVLGNRASPHIWEKSDKEF